MDFDINETTTEDANTVVNNGSLLLEVVSHILHTYAYLFIGALLILVNIPVFLLVIMHKTLRNPYAILTVAFFNSELTGVSAILLGVKRIIVSVGGERLIDHHGCVLNIPILLLTSYFLNGLCLLMNSIERLCVVAFPIYYYTHSTRIIYSLIAAQYVIAIIAITSTATASLIEPTRNISNFCWLQDVYSSHFYTATVGLTTAASFLSVVLMVIVVIILRKKFGAQFLSNHSRYGDLTQFLKNQKQYTQTSLISCCFTFFFVVLPSIAEYINLMGTSVVSEIIVMICVYLRLLNSCNMAIVFLYLQKDLRSTAIQSFKNRFRGRKDHVQSIKTTGFGK
uniref:G_PROTEIN_RECEP_F1_2 domain-containing protein n=1 Tax=Onchocerca volvulus TaxID=6282 RepID=A0A8R1XRW6_ONCVO